MSSSTTIAILLNQFRKRLAQYLKGEGTLKPIKYIGIGSGGHDPETEQVSVPDADATGLKHMDLVKELTEDSISQEDEFSVTGKCFISADELMNTDISEVGLFDEDMFCIGIYNFAPKHKETSDLYAFSVKLCF